MIKRHLIFVVLVFSIYACKDECVSGAGPRKLNTRTLQPASYVDVSISGNVFVEIDTSLNKTQIQIEGEENILEIIETTVNNNILSVSYSSCLQNHKEVSMTVRTPSLTGVTIDQVGKITSKDIIDVEDFQVVINGSGDCDLTMRVDQLTTLINGSGQVIYRGECNSHNLTINQSGDIEGFEMPSRTLDADISASGNALVRVSQTINANITGSGDIRYKGSPIINRTGDGSGEIIDDN
jgi:hypothetical protein